MFEQLLRVLWKLSRRELMVRVLRPAPRTPIRRQRTILVVERLEDRTCPSTTLSLTSSAYSVPVNAGSVTITAVLSAASSQTVGINYQTMNGTATAGVEYTAESGSLYFPAGQTTESFVVPIVNDPLPGATENFGVMLSSPTNASLGSPSSAGVTIVEPAPTISLSSSAISVAEGAGSVTITAVLSAASAQAITVNYATANGTATAGTQYTAESGTLHFAAGQTSQSFTVPILNDPLPGATENFSVALSSPSNASLGSPSSATVTITEPVPSVWLSSSACSVAETAATVTITAALSMASAQAVTVHYSTVDGTATAGTEYTAESGTLSIAAGQTSGTIVVPILNDPLPGATENFGVVLSSPSNASLGSPSSAGVTIIEPTPTVAIGNVTANEDASGTAPFAFNVSLSAASAQTITVGYSTASAGSNYSSASGTVTFAPGQTTQTVVIGVSGNLGSATSEAFDVNLSSPSNATLGQAQGVGTILNNVQSPVTYDQSYSVSPNTALSVAFPGIAGNADDPGGNWLALATINGQPVTFGAAITLPSGATVTPAADGSFVYVPPTGYAGTDAFVYTLTDGTNLSNPATVSINVVAPTISITNVIANEPSSGTAPFTFALSLSAPSSQTVTVHYATADAGAVGGTNYQTGSGTITFAPGQTTQTITVGVLGNLGSATSANFDLNLSSATNATLAQTQAVGTILNSVQDPVAANLSYVVSPNTPLSIDAPGLIGTATDPSGNPLSLATINGSPVTVGTVLTLASGATVTPYADGSFDYVPSTGYQGTDSFSYTLTDGTYVSNEATVSVQVVNPSLSITNVTANEPGSGSAPFAVTVSLSAPSNQTITVNVASADGTAIAGSNYQSMSTTLTFAPGQTSQTLLIPVTGNLGSAASATFYLNLSSPSNATLAQSQAVVTILNNIQAPLAGNKSFAAGPDMSSSFGAAALLGSASDPGGLAMTVATINGLPVTFGTPITLPSGALLTVNADGSFSYQAPSAFLGTDSVVYTLSDGTYMSNPATVAISVADPSVSIANETANEPSSGTAPLTFVVSLSEASGDDVVVNWQTSDGSAVAGTNYVAASGSVDFTPGQTSETVTVSVNGNLGSATSEAFDLGLSSPVGATLGQSAAVGTILNQALAPVAANTSFSGVPNTTLNASGSGLMAGASDPLGGPLKVDTINGTAVTVGSVVALPSGATVTVGANGSFSYVPPTDFEGTDSFTYTLSDGSHVSNPATASIVVSAGAPVDYGSNSYTTLSGVALPIDVLDSSYDANGQALQVINITGPNNGTVTLTSMGLLQYQSNTGYTGSDSFTFQLTDGLSTSSVQTISLNVVQQALVVNPVTVVAMQGDEVVLNAQDLLLSDQSANGAALTITPTSSPSNGTLSTDSQGTSWYYTPFSASFLGTDSVLATVSNGVASAVVTLLFNFEQPAAAAVGFQGSYLSSDGNFVATIGPDNTISVFDTRTGQRIGNGNPIQLRVDGLSKIVMLAFRPNSDNQLALAYELNDGSTVVRVWNLQAQPNQRAGFVGQGSINVPAADTLSSLSYSPDGAQLLVATTDGISVYLVQQDGSLNTTPVGNMSVLGVINAVFLPGTYRGFYAVQITQATQVSIWDEQPWLASAPYPYMFYEYTNLRVTLSQLADVPRDSRITYSAGSVLGQVAGAPAGILGMQDTPTLALALLGPPVAGQAATTVYLVKGPPTPRVGQLPTWPSLRVTAGFPSPVTSMALAFTPGPIRTRRIRLALGFLNGTVEFYNCFNWQPGVANSVRLINPNQSLERHLGRGGVTGISLTQNGDFGYSAGANGTIRKWSITATLASQVGVGFR